MAPIADPDGLPGHRSVSDSVISPQPDTAPAPDTAWVPSLVSAAAFATAIAGIAARLAYESFYRTLGLGVDDLGLSPARMLALGGVSLVAITGPVGLAAGIGWTIGRRFGRPMATAIAVGVATGVAGFVGLWFALRAAPLPATIIAIAVGLLCLTGPFVFHPGNSTQTARSTARLSAGICLVLLFVFWGWVMASAPSAANHLGTPRARLDIAAAVLDVHPEPVCATPLTPAVRLPTRTPLLFLGGGQGMLVLWDVGTRRYLKVPAGEVFLTSAVRGACPPDPPIR